MPPGVPLVLGWTQDDGATNAGPASNFPDEDSIKTPLQKFFHALTDEDYRSLFAMYPASDFEEDLANYEATKSDSDPDVPIHWFRASRILRDMLFTCSSLDFAFEMTKHSRTHNTSYVGARLYNLNQSMLTPFFKDGGMPYIAGAPHGSDYNFISNGVFPEGQVTGDDEALARGMAKAFIEFAYTGDPSSPWPDCYGHWLGEWPEAFPGMELLLGDGPVKVNMELFGGPLGTGPMTAWRTQPELLDQEDSMQIPLGMDTVELGEMDSPWLSVRNHELSRQKLLERCAFINTLAERLDI